MRVERIEVTGARGDPGISFAAPVVPGDFLVKAPGTNSRLFLGASGTGADAGLRTDLAEEDGVLNIGGAVSSRDALAKLSALDPVMGASVLTAGGRSGTFRWLSGNQSGKVSSDPLQGIYVAPTTDTSGASGCWARIWDGVHARPEWFGAVPNNGGFNCAPAINACLSIAPVALLAPEDYWISDIIKVNLTGRVLRGSAQHYTDGVLQTTRILTGSATLNPMIQVGGDSLPPGGRDAMVRGCRLEDVYLGRTTGPDKTVRPAGVSMQFVIGAEINRVRSADSTTGFRAYGAVASYMLNTNAKRVAAGTGSGVDTFTGYLVDGSAEIGLAGGNGSIYFVKTQVECNNADLNAGQSYGYRLSGKFQDTFMDWPESVYCNVGIAMEGGAGSGDADIKINHPIIDQPYNWGIYATGLSASSTLNIISPYVGHRASATQFGIYFNNCQGTINVLGGDILAIAGGQGVAIVGSRGVAFTKTIVKDAPGVALGIGGTCSSLDIDIVAHNPSATGTAAVQVLGTVTASRFTPVVYGKSGAFSYGIQVVGTADARNAYEISGIDSQCIVGGGGNKLSRDGTATPPGTAGTNIVTGNPN